MPGNPRHPGYVAQVVGVLCCEAHGIVDTLKFWKATGQPRLTMIPMGTLRWYTATGFLAASVGGSKAFRDGEFPLLWMMSFSLSTHCA